MSLAATADSDAPLQAVAARWIPDQVLPGS